jgi:cytochrome P450
MPALTADPLDGFKRCDRIAVYADLRDRLPVYWSSVRPAWIVSRYADVNTILRNPQSVAVEPGKSLRLLGQRGGIDLSSLQSFLSSMSFFTHPPLHDSLRRLLAQAVAAIRSPTLQASLERYADQLLDAGLRRGSIDLAEGYGKPLAMFVISRFFGVADGDMPRLSALISDLMEVFEFTLPTVKGLLRFNHCARELTEYFARLVASRRLSPGPDGISTIIRLSDEQLGRSDEEVAQYCLTLFMAAEVTTGAGISAAALELLGRPALSTQLRTNLSLLPSAAQELMRLNSPVQCVLRQVPADLTVAGETIRAGDPIVLMLGAANLDPRAFPNPGDVVLGRTEPKPLTFAAGAYACIGMQLATLEVEIGMRKLLDQPRLRLSAEAPVWSTRRNFESLERVSAIFM